MIARVKIFYGKTAKKVLKNLPKISQKAKNGCFNKFRNNKIFCNKEKNNMRKNRLVSLFVCAMMAAPMTTSFAACGGDSGSGTLPPEAEGKTVLTVGTYEGGMGDQWIKDSAAAFAELNKTVSFEEGKTGVYVDVQAHKAFNGSTLLTGKIDKDLYFTEDVSYYQHVSKGNFADITDIVSGENSSLAAYGESGTIADKLTDNQKGFLTAKDGHYYALPFYDGIYGFIYDRDLFSDNYWFFDADGMIGVNEFGVDMDGNELGLSGGADNNLETTLDNGLPATYQQFDELLYEMRSLSKIPFAYMGSGDVAYVKRMTMNFWADYEGLEKMNVNYTLDGEVELVESIVDGVVTTYTQKIDQSNGYLLQKQAGKYYALDFLERLLDEGDNYKVNRDTHTQAQRNFIRGSLTSADDYAMLIDGIWWENEARSVLADCETEFGKGRMDRRFAFLPIPKLNETELAKGKGQTLISLNNSFGFVNAKSKHIDLAKAFMQFLHTDVQLSAFTRETSATRSFKYAMNPADADQMTYFGKSVLELKAQSDIIYPVSSLDFINNNSGTFTPDAWAWSTKIGSTSYENPYAAFRANKTAKEYFEGLTQVVTEAKWNSLNRN